MQAKSRNSQDICALPISSRTSSAAEPGIEMRKDTQILSARQSAKRPDRCENGRRVIACKQTILRDQGRAPLSRCCTQNICMTRVPAHDNTVRGNGWQRFFRKVIHFGEWLAIEVDVFREKGSDLMSEMPRLNRKPSARGAARSAFPITRFRGFRCIDAVKRPCRSGVQSAVDRNRN